MTAPENSASAPDGTAGEAAPELKIIIVSENDRLSNEAMQTCGRLMAVFEESFIYRIAQGSFAVLEAPRHFREYLRAARSADLIFCISEHLVPGTAKRWIVDCIHRHQDSDFALVDMTAEGLTDSAAIQHALVSRPERSHPAVIRRYQSIQNTSTTSSSSWHIARPCHGPHHGINE
jgi:hypothetical protein